MNKEQIKKFVEDNPTLVKAKQTLNPELRVLKYNNRVFYKNLWTEELLDCRGTVIDKDWNIVSRPFTKIFNYSEKKAPRFKDDDNVIATRKINGFMGVATIHKEELLVSTTGTIDSEFADLARKWIEPFEAQIREYSTGYSFIFEIVDSVNDPHIVPEKDGDGVYLLNMRLKYWDSAQHALTETALDEVAEDCGFKRPDWRYTSFKEVKDEVKTCNHEGYVVYSTSDSRELKFKSPYYLVTKFLGRMGDKKVELMYEDTKRFKRMIDEEFYTIVAWIVRDWTMKEWLELDKQKRIDTVRIYIDRELALTRIDNDLQEILNEG